MDWTEEPECPYCGYENNASFASDDLEPDEKRVVCCPECDGPYQITKHVYYSTRPWTALDRAREGLACARIVERAMRRLSGEFRNWEQMPEVNARTCRLEALVERLSADAGGDLS